MSHCISCERPIPSVSFGYDQCRYCKERQEEADLLKAVRLQFQRMTKEEKIQRLKDIGILDSNGILSERYGGEGE